MTDLLVVGAGGLARETIEAVRAAASSRAARDGDGPSRLRVVGVLDDDPARHGDEVLGVPVIGGSDVVRERTECRVVVCVASPRNQSARAAVVARLGLAPERYATVVHPAAVVPDSCRVGVGSVLLAGVVLTADVTVGRHVVVMPNCVLTHDDVVGDFATLAAGIGLAGGVTVGEGAYLGAGVLVREYRTIGAGSLVGMGSLVLTDVGPGERWWGRPATRQGAVAGANGTGAGAGSAARGGAGARGGPTAGDGDEHPGVCEPGGAPVADGGADGGRRSTSDGAQRERKADR